MRIDWRVLGHSVRLICLALTLGLTLASAVDIARYPLKFPNRHAGQTAFPAAIDVGPLKVTAGQTANSAGGDSLQFNATPGKVGTNDVLISEVRLQLTPRPGAKVTLAGFSIDNIHEDEARPTYY